MMLGSVRDLLRDISVFLLGSVRRGFAIVFSLFTVSYYSRYSIFTKGIVDLLKVQPIYC